MVLEKICNSFLNIVDDKEPFMFSLKFCNGEILSHIIHYAIRGTF